MNNNDLLTGKHPHYENVLNNKGGLLYRTGICCLAHIEFENVLTNLLEWAFKLR